MAVTLAQVGSLTVLAQASILKADDQRQRAYDQQVGYAAYKEFLVTADADALAALAVTKTYIIENP